MAEILNQSEETNNYRMIGPDKCRGAKARGEKIELLCDLSACSASPRLFSSGRQFSNVETIAGETDESPSGDDYLRVIIV
jgi:hypothetical protein